MDSFWFDRIFGTFVVVVMFLAIVAVGYAVGALVGLWPLPPDETCVLIQR